MSACPRCGKPMASMYTADDPPIGVGVHECGGDPLARLTALLDAATPGPHEVSGFRAIVVSALNDYGEHTLLGGATKDEVDGSEAWANAKVWAMAPIALRHAVALAEAAKCMNSCDQENEWCFTCHEERPCSGDDLRVALAAFLSSIPEEGH